MTRQLSRKLSGRVCGTEKSWHQRQCFHWTKTTKELRMPLQPAVKLSNLTKNKKQNNHANTEA